MVISDFSVAMVMAPNLFRPMSDDPRVLLDNSRREINFLSNLIEHCDTSDAAHFRRCYDPFDASDSMNLDDA